MDKENPGAVEAKIMPPAAGGAASQHQRDPLAAINPKVLEAAAARRSNFGLTAKAVIQTSWAAAKEGDKERPAKRRLLKAGGNLQGSGYLDVVPANMLFGHSFKIPRLLRN